MGDKTQQENDDMGAAKRWADKYVAAMVGDLPILFPMTQRLLDSCKRDRCDGYYAGILHERSKKGEAASVDRETLKRFAEFVIDHVAKFVDSVITYYPYAIEKLVGDFLEQERAKKSVRQLKEEG